MLFQNLDCTVDLTSSKQHALKAKPKLNVSQKFFLHYKLRTEQIQRNYMLIGRPSIKVYCVWFVPYIMSWYWRFFCIINYGQNKSTKTYVDRHASHKKFYCIWLFLIYLLSWYYQMNFWGLFNNLITEFVLVGQTW
jgi:hypothetical protein